MENKSIKYIFIFFIYISFFVNIDKCGNDFIGKCVYLINDKTHSGQTGSEIINFHKYKNGKHSFSKDINNTTEIKKWSINLCNDTIYMINDSKKSDFQIIYQNNEENYGFAGPFLKVKNDNEKISLIKKNENQFIYKPQTGGMCDKTQNISYSTYVLFENSSVSIEEEAEIYELPKVDECNTTLKLHFNIEYAKDYLILQKIFNDCFIFSGITFIILGLYLSFLSNKLLSVTKIIISLIAGEIIVFSFEIIVIGNSSLLKDYLYILFIILGIIIGGVFSFLSFTHQKLYLILLSFSAGFINGIFIFDMFFIRTNSMLVPIIFIDTILIFSISFIVLMKIMPKYCFYYPPIIGSFLITRGLSILIYNSSDAKGFFDLQLLLYLMRRYEIDLAQKYLDNEFKYSWIYIILNIVLLIISEILNVFLYKNNENIYKEEEDDNGEELLDNNVSTLNLSDTSLINQ